MRFVGIDPGVNGGVGWIRTDENLAIERYDSFALSKCSEAELAAWLQGIGQNVHNVLPVILVESQGARPHDKPQNVAKLHHQWGVIRGIFIAFKIRFESVAPAVWQRSLGLIMPKDTSHTVKKNAHKAMAQQIFPEANVTHAVSDGLLIAEYGRRMYLRSDR